MRSHFPSIPGRNRPDCKREEKECQYCGEECSVKTLSLMPCQPVEGVPTALIEEDYLPVVPFPESRKLIATGLSEKSGSGGLVKFTI